SSEIAKEPDGFERYYGKEVLEMPSIMDKNALENNPRSKGLSSNALSTEDNFPKLSACSKNHDPAYATLLTSISHHLPPLDITHHNPSLMGSS
ncbi:hypothetical protein U1Q18_009064, partial [Sarracenia purpurea var. burkii]